MARVRGSTITARIRWVREMHGEPAWRDLRASLQPASRSEIAGGILPHDWASFDLFVDLCETMDRTFGKGDLALCYELGRYAAEVNLPTLYRIFLRFGSPMFLLERAARIWEVNYDSGRLEPIAEAKTEARLQIIDFERPNRVHCLSILGWASRAIELSGVKLIFADEGLCRTRGDETCEMTIRWR